MVLEIEKYLVINSALTLMRQSILAFYTSKSHGLNARKLDLFNHSSLPFREKYNS